MDYFTIEQLQKIYEENNVHGGIRYVMHPRPGMHEAHLNALTAVAEAIEERAERDRDACCEATAHMTWPGD